LIFQSTIAVVLLKLAPMTIQVVAPQPNQQIEIGTLIEFKGAATSEVARIRVTSPFAGAEYLLGQAPVENGKWVFPYTFNTAGQRTILFSGVDAASNSVANASLTINLVPRGTQPVGQIVVTEPVNQSVHEINNPIAFRGTATGDIANIRVRVVVAGTELVLGTTTVTDENWAFSYLFNTSGTRQLFIDGLDRSGRLVKTAQVTVTIKSSLGIVAPTNNQALPIDVPVELRGTAATDITSIRIVSPVGNVEYLLGATRVVNGEWQYSYTFNSEGDRQVIVYGLNTASNEIANAAIKIRLIPSGDDPTGRIVITSPADQSIQNLNAAITFQGTASGDVANVRARSPVAGVDLPLTEASITNGRWAFNYTFNSGGDRRIVVDGLDRSGRRLSSAVISLVLNSPINPNEPFGNGVIGIQNTTQTFRARVIEIANQLQTQPIFLMAVMSFETGGTFSPSIRNSQSGATGLIQFISSTAIALGTTTQALARMTAIQQLDFVEKYFRPYRGRLNTLEDAYMAVLYPIAIGRGRSYVLFRTPSIEYQQNRGLDSNQDGAITVAEAADLVRRRIL